MNKPVIMALAVGTVLLLGSKVASAASRTQNLIDKIKFYPGIPKYSGLKDGFLNFLFSVQVMNQSAFDLAIDNLFVSVRYIDPKTNKWEELLTQIAPVKVKTPKGEESTTIPIAKQRMSKFPPIPLSLPLSNAGVVSGLILGRINPTLKVVTRFEYAGIELPAIEQEINAKEMVAPVRSVLSSLRLLKGLGSNGIELA